MGILNDLLGSVKSTALGGSSVSGLPAPGFPGPVHPAMQGVGSALRRNVSTILQNTGDSTGDNTVEWFGLLGTLLGQAYPQYTVHWRQFDDTNQAYPRQATALQTGAGGQRMYGLGASANGGYYLNGPNIAGDLELIAFVKADTWARGTQQTIIAKWDGGTNQRSFQFFVTTDGKLGFSSSPDGGSASNLNVQSTVVIPFADGVGGWVRAQHVVSSAGNNVVTFQTSTDGATFTTLGSIITTSGATSHFASTSPWTVGTRNYTTATSDYFVGSIGEVWIQTGTSTTACHVMPTLLEYWEPTSNGGFANSNYTFSGAPILQLWAGSRSGKDVPYMDDSTRRPKVFANVGQQVLIVNMAMNDVGLAQRHARGTYQTWLTNVRTLLPGVPFICLGQNPVAIGTGGIGAQQGVDFRYLRNSALLQWAASGAVSGTWPMDKFPAWPAPFPSNLVPDGVHPSQGLTAGAGYEARYLLYRMFGITL